MSPPDTPIPEEITVRLGWRSATRWARILVPVVITLLVGAGGAAGTSLVRDADTRSTVRQLDERRHEAAEERQRIMAAQVEAERERNRLRLEVAEELREVSASLARIEARLDGLEERLPPRRR